MKVLYIDNFMPDSQTGGNAGYERNFAMVKYVFGEKNVSKCTLQLPSKFELLKNYLLNRSYFHNKQNNKIIDDIVSNGPYDFIFLNGPFIYRYLSKISNIKTVVYLYCHNVEADYYLSKYKINRSLQNYLMAKFAHRIEAYTVHKADIISTLNERDSMGLLRRYGRHADFILPIAMRRYEVTQSNDTHDSSQYGLFVGSNIGPNIEGLKWFFDNIAKYTIDVEYRIVGSCCESFGNTRIPTNVKLIGRVDDLAPYYNKASFVICPIFSGSGMKTKTIEALRFGKTIIGTQEAFEGIEIDFEKIGTKSDEANAQIEKIKSLDLSQKINFYSVKAFEDNFTYQTVFEKFKEQIEKRIQNDNQK